MTFDPASIADENAEQVMRKMILYYRPQDSIFGEEGGLHKGTSGLTWVLDPIDGTRGFIAGQTSWTVLVSLIEGKEKHFGIIYQPFTNEMFVGSKNASELISNNNLKSLGVRKYELLSNAISHTTDPRMGNDGENHVMNKLRDQCSFSRYSLDAHGLMAMGYIDLIIECSMQFYDLQAPIVIVESAGGIVSDWVGGFQL